MACGQVRPRGELASNCTSMGGLAIERGLVFHRGLTVGAQRRSAVRKAASLRWAGGAGPAVGSSSQLSPLRERRWPPLRKEDGAVRVRGKGLQAGRVPSPEACGSDSQGWLSRA